MKYPGLYNIIFSDDRSFRLKRHFLFFTIIFFYHLLRIGIMTPMTSWRAFLSVVDLSFFWGVILNMFFSYSISYFLIPKYFKKRKYFFFVFGIVFLYCIVYVLLRLIGFFLLGQPVFRGIGYGNIFLFLDRATVIRLFGNPPLICGLFLSLKTLKSWYLEQSVTEVLAKENANAELQLLKAQIHPHFLFNTLNNIYSFSLYRSPQAGALVKKLSGMLGYMINECDEKLVPLEKEISLIQDYMGLEKVRYGQRLTMDVEIHGDFENKLIAPLLMIPFIENSFKHGTSQMLQQPWIKLEITTIDSQLFFKLSNSKPSLAPANKQSKGIGLLNVKKRLQLLYPGRHQLDIHSTDDTFTVNMQLLVEKKTIFAGNKLVQAEKTIAYA